MSLTKEDRERVIYALFDELTSSAFAEGCEARIADGLNARTDDQLISLAREKHTWIPQELSHKKSELPS